MHCFYLLKDGAVVNLFRTHLLLDGDDDFTDLAIIEDHFSHQRCALEGFLLKP